MKNDFKGNKSSLPSKPCAVCQRPMTWRKAWAKNWESVRYCSDACRAKKGTAPSIGGSAGDANHAKDTNTVTKTGNSGNTA
jgi:hypothetical protein